MKTLLESQTERLRDSLYPENDSVDFKSALDAIAGIIREHLIDHEEHGGPKQVRMTPNLYRVLNELNGARKRITEWENEEY